MSFLFPHRSYHHLNKIIVKRSALEHNHQFIKELATNNQVAPVLKSNAYGHGLKLVAPVFDQLKPPFLIVDSLYEAYELYKIKLKTPILIIGYTDPRNYRTKQLPFHYTVFDLATAQALNKHQPGSKIHLFIDTGMNREGIKLENLPQFLDELSTLKNLQIEGLASHLADADHEDSDAFTKKQLSNYQQAEKILNQRQIFPRYKHLAASAGLFQLKKIKKLKNFNLIRAGLISYGLNPFSNHDLPELQPALTFETTISQIKNIKAGQFISYNCTYQADQEMTIGTLPAGYFEGVDRRLSNSGVVKVKEKFCPILGRVCMNLTIIDLSQIKNPQVGMKAEIYSAHPLAQNSITHQAQTAQTIPYQLLASLDASVKRKLE